MTRVLLICRSKIPFTDKLTSDLSLGGIQACNFELARALVRRGHDVTIASDDASEGISFGSRHISIGKIGNRNFDLNIISNTSSDFDRLNSHNGHKVLWMHNPLAIEKAFRYGFLFPILRHRPLAVFVSEHLRAHMAPYPFAGSEVIGHGVDEAFLEPDAPKQEIGSALKFVFASQRHRGFDRTLSAWRDHIAPALPRAEFHVIGSGSVDPQGAPRVFFHGQLTKRRMREVYIGATAMLYPGAKDETFCLAAAEAQCCGLPVVTLGIGSLKERVRHGVDGFICNDYDDMVEKAVLIAHNRDIYLSLRDGAITNRVNRSWDFVAKLWEQLVFCRYHGA